MNVLLLGGSGFIGPHLTEALLAESHQVIWLNRGLTPAGASFPVSRLTVDRNDADELRRALRGITCDAIVDLSGYTPAQLAPVLEAMPDDSPAHYIFLSSVAVYQGFSGWAERGNEPWSNYFRIPIDEHHVRRPTHRYGRDKLDCETMLLEARARRGLRCTILRLPPVFGPGDYKCRELFYIRRVREMEALLLPEGGHNLIHHLYVKDLARTCLRMMGRDETFGEVYNLATGEAITLRRYVALIAQAMRRPIRFVDLTAEEARGRFGPSFYRRWPYLQPYHFVLDTSKVRKVLRGDGDVAHALEETTAWYAQVGDEFLQQRAEAMQRISDPGIGLYTIEPCEIDLAPDRAVLAENLAHVQNKH